MKRLGGPPARSPAGVGARRPRSRRADGVAIGRNLRGVGINVDLAPVLDWGCPDPPCGRSAARRATAPRVSATAARSPTDWRPPACSPARSTSPASAAGWRPGRSAFNRIDGPLERCGVDEAPFRDAAARGVPLTMVSSGIYPALVRASRRYSRRRSPRPSCARGSASAALDQRRPRGPGARNLRLSARRSPRCARGRPTAVRTDAAGGRSRGARRRGGRSRSGAISRAAVDAGADRALALRDRLR